MHKLYYFFSTTHLHPHLIQFRSVHSHYLLYFFFLKKHVPSRCILGYLKGQSWKFSIRRRRTSTDACGLHLTDRGSTALVRTTAHFAPSVLRPLRFEKEPFYRCPCVCAAGICRDCCQHMRRRARHIPQSVNRLHV